MSHSSSTLARDHGNRMSTGSMKKSPATITPKSDVKKEVLSTPRRSTKMQHQHSTDLTPATATTAIDTTTPALAKLGKMVIEHLQSSGGAINQMQQSGGAVQSYTGAVQNSTGAVQDSTAKPKRNRRNKKATPPEPRRFGTRQRKRLNDWTTDSNASSRQTRHHTMER
jgi:hypothetical protein